MEDFMFTCKYGDERIATQYHTCRSYDHLVRVIIENWHNLMHEPFSLLYSTPGLDKYLLKDENDFRCMLQLASIYSLRIMEITIKAPFTKRDNNFETGGSSNNRATVDDEFAERTSYLSNQRGILGGKLEFRDALDKYAVDRGFSVGHKRNDKKSIIAFCKNDDGTVCPWHINASICLPTGYFVIRKLINYHTCNARLNREASKQLSSKLVSRLITKPLANKGKPWAPNDVSDHLKQCYGQDVGYTTACHALNKAKEQMFGSSADSYKQLWWYSRAAVKMNPGSKIVLQLDDETTNFKRIFVAWGSCIEGFKYVKPTLFLDGTFLKGKYIGCLLSATGKKANQELYPIAYAIVDIATGDNWKWFLKCLRDVLGQEHNITFVTDRHAGLLDALSKIFPKHSNFFCMRHLEDNLRGKFSGKMVKWKKDRIVTLFTQCAKAPTTTEFERCLEEFTRVGGKIAEKFLLGLDYEKWTNAFSQGRRYGEMTSNAAESFNNWIKEARCLPIMQCIDKLREKLMLWFEERRTTSDKWHGYICPNMEKKLEGLISDGRTWKVRKSEALVFEVHDNESHSVNFRECTCTCNWWQLKGFPCAHAVACVNKKLRLQDYIEDHWFVDSYQSSYDQPIMPIPTSVKEQYMLPDDPIILPPNMKRSGGRPRTERIKTKGERENIKSIRCSRCNQFGSHNKKTCNALV